MINRRTNPLSNPKSDVDFHASEMHSHAGNFYPFLHQHAAAQSRRLSHLHTDTHDLDAWRQAGQAKMKELLLYDPPPVTPEEEILSKIKKDGYTRYHVRYPITADRYTEAFLFIPEGLQTPAPAIMALHDHGGFYYYGKEKITAMTNPPPCLQRHLEHAYEGRPFADELARRGFVVLAPDAFYFGSQRLEPVSLPMDFTAPFSSLSQDHAAFAATHQQLAGPHEELMAKTIFTAGTTWPGILFQGDRASLDYLLTRPEVDPDRIGCMGLSIGGFRSAHLFGLDPRIKAGVVAGWMTTYETLLFDHLRYHTWMIYVPGQLAWLDLPDVVTLNVPRPLMVINCLQDILFTLEGMQEAEHIIKTLYAKTGAADCFSCRYFDTPHSLNIAAQDTAIQWLQQWLMDSVSAG